MKIKVRAFLLPTGHRTPLRVLAGEGSLMETEKVDQKKLSCNHVQSCRNSESLEGVILLVPSIVVYLC